MELHLIIDILRNTLLITGLVLIMMLLIEYFNVYSQGRWYSHLQGSSFKQVVLGAVLGIIPGCLGGFAAVSLYTHRLLTFGALIAMMICSSGDEAFVMLAMIPRQALLLGVIVLAVGIITGLIVDRIHFFKHIGGDLFGHSHSEDCGHDHSGHLLGHNCGCTCGDEITIHAEDRVSMPSIFKASSYSVMKHPGWRRVVLLAGIALFLSLVGGGLLEHDHSAHAHGVEMAAEHPHSHHTDACCEHDHLNTAQLQHANCEHVHQHAHQAEEHSLNLLEERWMHLMFAIFSIITLFFTATASEHFIREHIWNHVVKKHALSIFCWTLGALAVCQLGVIYLDLEHLINDNMVWVMILAALVGIIPESGPHLIFVTLFANGMAPFYVLLVNSIVQDGHSTIPLLAHSRRSFIWAKLVNVFVGLAVGFAFMAFMQ